MVMLMEKREIIFLNSVFFVIGFTLVFSILGILFQTILAHASFSLMNILRIAGGVVIIAFGILIVASVKYIIPFFSTEHRIKPRKFSNSYLTSLVFGIAFALGWTPCVGAILGAIYILAATSPGLGFLLLLAYSLGLGIPFLIFGAFISKVSDLVKRIHGFLKYFNIISGLFLVAIGLLVVTGYIGVLAVFLTGPQGPMSLNEQLNFLIAIVAGVLTFLSPCILPLLPAYFSYMAGTATEEVRK
jgi:cytochrome c-type biogenesis protein